MSIIQEALKKVEPVDSVRTVKDARAEKASSPDVIPAKAEQPVPVKRRAAIANSPSKIPVFIVGVIALALTGTGIFYILKRPAPSVPAPAVKPLEEPASHQDTIYKTIEQSVTGDPGAAVAKDIASSPPSIVRAEPPDLVLNGIMYLETGPRAIINNAIVSEGDMINGATVSSINRKNVILKFNNLEITLNLK